ncbi:MAG: FAD-binding protein [Edaphobacter sp.]
MNKREFLKASGAVVAGAMVSRIARGQKVTSGVEQRTNWAGNYTYRATHLDVPANVEQVKKEILAHARVKALGARHSFNSIADSSEEHISLKQFDGMELDEKSRTVTVGAGVTYGQLAPYLDVRGFAVHNMASLPHISVVGACATGTHGSGSTNGNLSTAVRAMEMVTANGDTVTLSKDLLQESFAGTVVGLGALGVITKITLEVEPAFQMTQVVYEDLSFSQLEENLEAIFASGYSVSLFTDWQKHRATQVWIKQKTEPGVAGDVASDFYGAKPARRKMHPIADHSAESCTEQMGVPGPWFERLPHFKMNFTPSSGAELQTEYFVPRAAGYGAIAAVEELRDQITPHLFITEFRTIAADELWMSPAYQRDSMAIHFTWKPEWEAVRKVLPQIEEKLTPFGVRPHWAKLFTLKPAVVQEQYARLKAFRALAGTYDPTGRFRNEFLDLNVFGV